MYEPCFVKRGLNAFGGKVSTHGSQHILLRLKLAETSHCQKIILHHESVEYLAEWIWQLSMQVIISTYMS